MQFLGPYVQRIPGTSKMSVVPLVNLAQNSTNIFPEDTDLSQQFVFAIGLPAYNWGTSFGPKAAGVGTPLLTPSLAVLLDSDLTIASSSKDVLMRNVPFAQLLATGTAGSGDSRPALILFEEPIVLSLTNCQVTYNNQAGPMAANTGIPLVMFYGSPEEGYNYIREQRARAAVMLAQVERDPTAGKWMDKLGKKS